MPGVFNDLSYLSFVAEPVFVALTNDLCNAKEQPMFDCCQFRSIDCPASIPPFELDHSAEPAVRIREKNHRLGKWKPGWGQRKTWERASVPPAGNEAARLPFPHLGVTRARDGLALKKLQFPNQPPIIRLIGEEVSNVRPLFFGRKATESREPPAPPAAECG